ncbi:MAG: heparinase, partial [Acidobacteriales bacterium]
TYTAKTFSPQRYEIWVMQSAYHNLPTVNGVMQAAGREFAAREVSHRADDAAAEFSLDIAGAWPPEAGLVSYRRTLRLDRRANRLDVSDRYGLKSAGGRIVLTLMTPRAVRVDTGRLTLGSDVVVSFDAQALKPAVEEIRIADERLRPQWGERLYRIQLTAEGLPAEGEFKLRIEQV